MVGLFGKISATLLILICRSPARHTCGRIRPGCRRQDPAVQLRAQPGADDPHGRLPGRLPLPGAGARGGPGPGRAEDLLGRGRGPAVGHGDGAIPRDGAQHQGRKVPGQEGQKGLLLPQERQHVRG